MEGSETESFFHCLEPAEFFDCIGANHPTVMDNSSSTEMPYHDESSSESVDWLAPRVGNVVTSTSNQQHSSSPFLVQNIDTKRARKEFSFRPDNDNDSEIDRLNALVEKYKAKYDQAHESSVRINNHWAECQDRVNRYKSENQELARKNNDLVSQNFELRQKIEQLQENSSRPRQPNFAFPGLETNVEENVRQIEADLRETMQRTVQYFEESLQQCGVENERLVQRIAELENELNAVKGGMASEIDRDKQNLEKYVQELEENASFYRENIENLERENQELADRLREMDKQTHPPPPTTIKVYEDHTVCHQEYEALRQECGRQIEELKRKYEEAMFSLSSVTAMVTVSDKDYQPLPWDLRSDPNTSPLAVLKQIPLYLQDLILDWSIHDILPLLAKDRILTVSADALGEGAYGEVRLLCRSDDCSSVAKISRAKDGKWNESLSYMVYEVMMHQFALAIDANLTIRIYDAFVVEKKAAVIVFERALMDVWDALHPRKGINKVLPIEFHQEVVRKFFLAMDHGLLHCDVGTPNVLIVQRYGEEVPMLADWGLSIYRTGKEKYYSCDMVKLRKNLRFHMQLKSDDEYMGAVNRFFLQYWEENGLDKFMDAFAIYTFIVRYVIEPQQDRLPSWPTMFLDDVFLPVLGEGERMDTVRVLYNLADGIRKSGMHGYKTILDCFRREMIRGKRLPMFVEIVDKTLGSPDQTRDLVIPTDNVVIIN